MPRSVISSIRRGRPLSRVCDRGGGQRMALAGDSRIAREQHVVLALSPPKLTPSLGGVSRREAFEVDSIRDDMGPDRRNNACHLRGLDNHGIHEARKSAVRANDDPAGRGDSTVSARRTQESSPMKETTTGLDR